LELLTKNLFKFHTLSHGTSVNHEVKIGIRDIKLASEVSDPNGYGTFTVEVRRVNTTNIPNHHIHQKTQIKLQIL
jgi:hypothetical protein